MPSGFWLTVRNGPKVERERFDTVDAAVDELLATKLRDSGIEEHIEVVAEIDAEHEKRLVPVFRI